MQISLAIIRTHQSQTLSDKMTWHKYAPFKMSFFLWRLLGNNEPVDTSLSKFGVAIPSKCFCCAFNFKQEEAEHLFVNSEVGRTVWNFFNKIMGISNRAMSIRQMMMNWWTKERKSPMIKLAIQIVPATIIWKIWKARSNNGYENKKMNHKNIIKNTIQQVVIIAHK